jgi:hypothetical protein
VLNKAASQGKASEGGGGGKIEAMARGSGPAQILWELKHPYFKFWPPAGRERWRTVAIALYALVAMTMSASAQSNPQTSANEMLPGCKGLISDKTPPLREALRQGRCTGYVAGLV